jgi:uracil-DNA glycosylase
LDKIALEIKNCKTCKVGKSGLPVPGEGNPDADIVFIGEAPGKKEAATGRPFIGRSGQLLRGLIREAGLREEDVFITSPVKYLPNGPDGTPGGTPKPSDIAHGRIHLMKQFEVIQPKVIVLLGAVATLGVLKIPTSPRLRGARKIQVKKDHGMIIEQEGRKHLITLHPAAALRFPPLKLLMKEDFVKLKSLLSQ